MWLIVILSDAYPARSAERTSLWRSRPVLPDGPAAAGPSARLPLRRINGQRPAVHDGPGAQEPAPAQMLGAGIAGVGNGHAGVAVAGRHHNVLKGYELASVAVAIFFIKPGVAPGGDLNERRVAGVELRSKGAGVG